MNYHEGHEEHGGRENKVESEGSHPDVGNFTRISLPRSSVVTQYPSALRTMSGCRAHAPPSFVATVLPRNAIPVRIAGEVWLLCTCAFFTRYHGPPWRREQIAFNHEWTRIHTNSHE